MGGTRGSGVVSSAGDVLEMSVVGGVRGGVCVFGSGRRERIGFRRCLYQFCRNRGSLGRMSVFGLRYCG